MENRLTISIRSSHFPLGRVRVLGESRLFFRSYDSHGTNFSKLCMDGDFENIGYYLQAFQD
jgi:hypothetical protein